MPVLIATAKAADANAYVTVARADQILGRRLYTNKWDSASATPNAEGYLVNSGSLTLNATSVPVDTGAGTFTVGSKITIAGDPTVYTVGAALTGNGTLTISPGLFAVPADNAAITRISASDKEKSLIWASSLFDELMVWNGTKRTKDQRMRWPRSGVVNPDGFFYDYDTIPEILEVATSEFALVLLERNKFKLPGILGQGISSATLGPLRVDVDAAQQEAVIPDNILALLSGLGYLESEAQGGTRIIPMKRV